MSDSTNRIAPSCFDVMQPDESVNVIDLLLVTDLEIKPVLTNGKP